MAEYHKLKLEIAQLEKKMMTEITRPERVLYFLLPGRLVCTAASSLYAYNYISYILPFTFRSLVHLGINSPGPRCTI